jgi:hypothetical protein
MVAGPKEPPPQPQEPARNLEGGLCFFGPGPWIRVNRGPSYCKCCVVRETAFRPPPVVLVSLYFWSNMSCVLDIENPAS